MKNNQKGFSVLEILIVIVVVGLIGAVGWLVYDRQQNKTDNQSATTQGSQQMEEKKEVTPKQGTKSNVPEGWVQYQDTTNSVSFYYPADWDKSKFHIYKTPISETVKGTNFGPYSAGYIFKKAENKWYAVDFDGNQVAPYSGYTTVTTITASSYPAVYGYTGEGGGTSYYTVFTDGISSYMIELPTILEVTDSSGFSKQKQAIANLVASIKLGN